MTITLSELESAFATFLAGLFGYIAANSFDLGTASWEHGAIVGVIAALTFLGYNVVAGNVSAAPAKAA